MGWKKGESGNPAGKPKGAGSRSTEIRTVLHSNATALAEKAVQMALAGDATALRICLERLCPALRPKDQPIQMIITDGGLSDLGRSVLEEMGAGRLTPSETTNILGALSHQAKLMEMEELTRRIEALEQARDRHDADYQDQDSPA